VLEEDKRRRTIEILKCRGTEHSKGEFPLTVAPGMGIVTIPLSAIELKQHSFQLPQSEAERIAKLFEPPGGGKPRG